MGAFEVDIPADAEHEQVGALYDRRSGLRAIVAIHSTALGPALGGTRCRPYESFANALDDVLALSRAMSYKAALAGIGFGGGKGVIIGEPAVVKTPELWTAYAGLLDSFGGRYLTAEDVGMSQADMDFLGSLTPHVTGRSTAAGGSGDPSPLTAYGVVRAMEAAGQSLWGSPELKGRHVAISGVGKVGGALAVLCAERGALLTIADVDRAALGAAADAVRAAAGATASVEVAAPEAVHATPCDIFAPCALGGAIDRLSLGELACQVICGAANNQLAAPGLEDELAAAGIAYVPDYLANAGGIINISHEHGGYDPDAAREAVGRIFDTTLAVFAEARHNGEGLCAVADRLAEERMAAAS